jgi:hypothetical protein
VNSKIKAGWNKTNEHQATAKAAVGCGTLSATKKKIKISTKKTSAKSVDRIECFGLIKYVVKQKWKCRNNMIYTFWLGKKYVIKQNET